VKQLGIIAALPAEARCLAGTADKTDKTDATPSSPYRLSNHVCLMVAGIGPKQASNAAAALIQQGADALLSWGCAGAISADIQPGTLMLPQIILSQSGLSQTEPSQATKPRIPDTLHTDSAWLSHLSNLLSNFCKPVTGVLVSSNDIITKPAQKQALYQSSGAVAVDMESAAIAKAALDADIPFMAIRAIADAVDTTIPAYISGAMDIYGNINPVRMLGLLLTHPASWLQLMRLGREFNNAKATLSLVSETLGVDALLPPTRSD